MPSLYPLLTKNNILHFCRYARSEKSIFRYFGITFGTGEQLNKRYETRFYLLRNNLMKKGYITESEGKYLTVKGDYAKRQPSPELPAPEASLVAV